MISAAAAAIVVVVVMFRKRGLADGSFLVVKGTSHTHAALLYFCLLTLPLTSSTIATVLARENVITKRASSLPLFDPLAPLSRHCGQLENQIDAVSILV